MEFSRPRRWPRCALLLLFGFTLVLGGPWPLHGAATAQDIVTTPDLSTVTLAPNDCAFLIQGSDDPRERLGDIACGTLDVPENWSDPEGRRLQIGYLILKSTGAEPMPDPVVHLGGGPGYSQLSAAESWAGVFATLRQEQDIVLFDPRWVLPPADEASDGDQATPHP